MEKKAFHFGCENRDNVLMPERRDCVLDGIGEAGGWFRLSFIHETQNGIWIATNDFLKVVELLTGVKNVLGIRLVRER